MRLPARASAARAGVTRLGVKGRPAGGPRVLSGMFPCLLLCLSLAPFIASGCARGSGVLTPERAASPAMGVSSVWGSDRPVSWVPEPDRIVILPGEGGSGGGFTLAPGGPGYGAILAYTRRLAGEATAVTLDAGAEVATEAGGDEIREDLGGALLVYSQPATLSFTTPIDLRLRGHLPDPWVRFHAQGVTGLFIPCPAWSEHTPVGSFYILHKGGWLAPEARQPHDRPPETSWATLWSPLAETVGPDWLESLLARYLRPQDLRPGWPLPPGGIPVPRAPRWQPGVDPIWHKPPIEPLPTPSRVVVYLRGGTRLDLPPAHPCCRRLYRVLEATLDSTALTRPAYDVPLGLYREGGPEPDWPGVLLIYDKPVPLVLRTAPTPWWARELVVAWWEDKLPTVFRAYFPGIAPQADRPGLSGALYVLCTLDQDERFGIHWGVGNADLAAEARQRALGSVLEQLERELGRGIGSV